MVMRSYPEHILLRRLLPKSNPDQKDRALAWEEWEGENGGRSVRRYIRYKNDTSTPDGDIFQDSLLIAYLEVERGRYQPRQGVPFAAYVKGIAHNKIREARRRQKRYVPLDDVYLHIPAGRGAEPDHVYEFIEQQARLDEILTVLSHGRRQVIVGFLQGKSTKEIAQELSMSEDLVRQHKSRGLKKLRKMNFNAE